MIFIRKNGPHAFSERPQWRAPTLTGLVNISKVVDMWSFGDRRQATVATVGTQDVYHSTKIAILEMGHVGVMVLTDFSHVRHCRPHKPARGNVSRHSHVRGRCLTSAITARSMWISVFWWRVRCTQTSSSWTPSVDWWHVDRRLWVARYTATEMHDSIADVVAWCNRMPARLQYGCVVLRLRTYAARISTTFDLQSVSLSFVQQPDWTTNSFTTLRFQNPKSPASDIAELCRLYNRANQIYNRQLNTQHYAKKKIKKRLNFAALLYLVSKASLSQSRHACV